MNISAGGYWAKIRTFGGGLSELKFRNRDLIEPFKSEENDRYFPGALLAPWPNRIRDGRYNLHGRQRQIPINEGQRRNALHGLVSRIEWRLLSRTFFELELGTTLFASDYYPSDLEMRAKYRVGDQGLEWRLVAKNVGNQQVPYGASVHPYLIAMPETKVDDWLLQIPADKILEVDEDRLLPKNLVRAESLDFEFKVAAPIGQRAIDHAFKFVDHSSERRVDIFTTTGEGVRMEFDESAKWIQIHTADRFDSSSGRKSLAVEPMSCPPDAFNSGVDLVWLSPGDSMAMTWKISAIKRESSRIARI